MNELETLKNLIFGSEREELESVAERIEELERDRDLPRELPDAIRQSHERSPRLTRSLQKPVLDSFAQSVRENPDGVSNVLFPVIGPAIRKAIQDALRALSEQLTQAIDNSLTPRGLRWRVQAWRAGVPFGEYVLQKTLLYRVEHAYLIRRESGLLISHVHQEATALKDDDAVSAMLTAIQDFVKDSFTDDDASRLETARMGEHTLWAVHGPHTILACFIRGVPPSRLGDDIKQILEEINLEYGDSLAAFNGDKALLPGIDTQLRRCLQLELKREEAGKSSWSLIVLGAVLAAVVLYFLGSQLLLARKMDAYRSAVEETPGLVLTRLDRQGSSVSAHGLRDPLAPTPEELAARVGFSSDTFSANFSSYQSLEPALLLKRAANMLAAPDTVSLAIDGDKLLISGAAPFAWRKAAEMPSRFIPGVSDADFSGLDYFDEEWLQSVRDRIGAPETVKFSLHDRTLVLSGEAPQHWIDTVDDALATLGDVFRFDASALVAAEQGELRSLAAEIDGQEILFSSGVRLLKGESEKVNALASRISALGRVARAAELLPQIRLIGHTDLSGSRAINEMTRINRAKAVRSRLIDKGIAPGWLLVESAPQGAEFGEADLSRRKLVMRVGLVDSTGRNVLEK